MLDIKYTNILDDELKNTINAVFTEYALSCGTSSKYQDFVFWPLTTVNLPAFYQAILVIKKCMLKI